MAVVDRPITAVVDPGGVLLCHRDELSRQEGPGSSDQVLDDQTVEIHTKICLELAKKSEAKSHGHIPLGHMLIDEWK